MRCASCFDANGCTRMALEGECRVTIRYWLPLLARGAKRPVSSVKIFVIGTTVMSSVGAVGETVRRQAGLAGSGCRVDRTCWRGCAMCPLCVSSVFGQYLATNVGVSPGQL